MAEQQADWVLGFADETWWSRFAQPHLHSWADQADGPLRLVEQEVPKADPDPKALACYGVLLRQVEQPERVWLRFVDGRPVRAVTEQFLGWCCGKLQEAGVRVWVLIWDNASWHVSKRVRAWIRAHNLRVKKEFSDFDRDAFLTNAFDRLENLCERAVGVDVKKFVSLYGSAVA